MVHIKHSDTIWLRRWAAAVARLRDDWAENLGPDPDLPEVAAAAHSAALLLHHPRSATPDSPPPAFWSGVPCGCPTLRNLLERAARPTARVAAAIAELCALLVVRKHLSAAGLHAVSCHPAHEAFLSVGAPNRRAARGMYFTPPALAEQMIRSLDERVVHRWRLPDGLATAERPLILFDPAAGSGVFLVEAVHGIRRRWEQTAAAHGVSPSEAWVSFARRTLLPRLVACEWHAPSLAVCRLAVAAALAQTGYPVQDHELPRLFHRDALELALPDAGSTDDPLWQSLTPARQEGGGLLLIGNPPWANRSANLAADQRRLVERYRRLRGPEPPRNPLQCEKNLNDDYVKFFALAETLVEGAARGAISLVTNHSYLDGEYHAGLRRSLLATFDELHALDLHGNHDQRERAPDGTPDENLFGVATGAAVLLALRDGPRRPDRPPGTLHCGDLWGRTAEKLETLAVRSVGQLTRPADRLAADARFRPASAARDEFSEFAPLSAWLPDRSAATETGFDRLLLAFTREELLDQVRSFAADPDEPLRRWAAAQPTGLARRLADRPELLDLSRADQYAQRIQFRPWDFRWVWLQQNCLKTNAFRNMRRLAPERPGLAVGAKAHGPCGALAVGGFFSHKLIQTYDRSLVMPADALPAEEFHLLLALLQSRSYALRYAAELRAGLPQLPRRTPPPLRQALVPLGAQFAAVHLGLPEHATPPDAIRAAAPPFEIDRHLVRYDPAEEACWLGAGPPLRGVPAAAAAYTLGSYRLWENWARQRHGRTFGPAEEKELSRLLAAAARLAALTEEVDRLIALHGGWPEAFRLP